MAFNPNEHLMNLKGKQYLQVMHRLVWFRDAIENGHIATEHVSITEDSAVFKATITITNDDGMVLKSATGYGSETKRDFLDFIEKAETKAVGRALAMIGYGTQFAPEFDEGDRIVDSPVPPRTDSPTPMRQQPAPRQEAVYQSGPFRAVANAPRPNGPVFVIEEEQQEYITTRAASARNPKDFEPLLAMVKEAPGDVAREAIFLLLIESVPSVTAMKHLRGFGMTHKIITPKCAEHMNYHAANLPETASAA